MTECIFRRKISAYFDGELSENERLTLNKHLADCEECSTELTSIEQVSAVFASEDLPKIPPALLASVQTRTRVGAKDIRRTAGILTAASIALIIASVALLLSGNLSAPESGTITREWDRAASNGWFDTYDYTNDSAVQLAYGFFTTIPEEDAENE